MASPPPPTGPSPTDIPILFRQSKKRKLYRQRETSPPAAPPPSADRAPAIAQTLDELVASGMADAEAEAEADEGVGASLAEILRLRKQQRKTTKSGVEFRAEGYGKGEGSLGELREEGREGEEGGEEVVRGVVRRFAPQTGVVGKGDVDRHMMAYIDSELAKRRQEGTATRSQQPSATFTTTASAGRAGFERDKGKDIDIQRQPAALGKLLEIDLGDEARDRNVERTEQARRRMDGEVVEEEPAPKGKVRLGRDGKPWRPRKRRGSEDIKRDKLVEDVLRENRLEMYDDVPAEPVTANDNQAADDIIAEAFRKEFMDAVSQRQRKKTAPAQPPSRGPGGKREEELKGPKLGGSRSARAAMRETLLKNTKK